MGADASAGLSISSRKTACLPCIHVGVGGGVRCIHLALQALELTQCDVFGVQVTMKMSSLCSVSGVSRKLSICLIVL